MIQTLREKISKKLLLALGIGGGVFFLIQLLPLPVSNIRLHCFSEPAARIAAAFMGISMNVGADSISLSHPGLDVAVTEACSGFDFFALLAGLLIGLAVFHQSSKAILRDAFFLLAMAYGLTVSANTSRIICAVQIRVATADLLPSLFNASIHQTIGVIIFVTILALSWTSVAKIYDRKHQI